jgi:hypothetical protein
MNSDDPANGPQQRSERGWKRNVIFALKILGVIALGLLIVAGIALGTCMYILQSGRLR